MSFILKEQNMQVARGRRSRRASRARSYLSVGQFAAEYGQPASNINALTSYLAGFGISTNVYADDLDVVATGTAGEFDQALTITEKNVAVPQQPGPAAGSARYARSTCTPTSQPPLLPYRLASFVTAILGLSNYGPYVSDVAQAVQP